MNRTDGGACYPTQRNRLRTYFFGAARDPEMWPDGTLRADYLVISVIYTTARKGSVINGRYKIAGCFVKFSNERVRQTTLVSCVTAGLGPARWQAIAWAKDDADRLPRCRYVSRWRVPRIAESS